MGRTLSIELGIRCNNNCLFCYQRNLRTIKDYPKKLPLEDVKRKLEWGWEHGFVHVGFEGGEPTVRDDLVEIISFAKSIGYRRIGITTNGRRLANHDLAKALVDAGLNGVGFSIHGPDAQTHQAHTLRRRSFEQAMAGIDNMVRLGRTRRIDFNIFTVVTRKNVDRLPEIGRMFAKKGIRLLILQPLTYSKGNFQDFHDLVLPMDRLVHGIRAAIYDGMRHGYHVKLFNLPPCLFSDILPGLEMDPLPPSIFREDETDRAGELLAEEDGYVRLSTCRFCALRHTCPGLTLSLLPQFDLLQVLRRSMDYHRGPSEELWLTGMELSGPATAFDTVRYAVSSGYKSIKFLTGGTMTQPLVYKAAVRAGVDEVILVHRPRDERSNDRVLKFAGNGAFLTRTARDIQSEPVRLTLFSAPGKELDRLLNRFKALDIDLAAVRLTLSGPGLHLCGPKGFSYLRNLLKNHAIRIIIELEARDMAKFYPCLLMVAGASFGRISFHLPVKTVLRTPFSLPRYGLLNWSDPMPLNLPPAPKEITVVTLMSQPLTMQRLKEAMVLRRLNETGQIKLVD